MPIKFWLDDKQQRQVIRRKPGWETGVCLVPKLSPRSGSQFLIGSNDEKVDNGLINSLGE